MDQPRGGCNCRCWWESLRDLRCPQKSTGKGHQSDHPSTLRRARGELQNAYPALQEDILEALRQTFELGEGPVQPLLVARSAPLLGLAGEPELKAFLMRAADSVLASEEWLVSLATFLGTKPPSRWNDTDIDTMQAKLARLAPKFRAVESLAVQLDRSGGDARSLVRLSITQPNLPELEKVIAVPPGNLEHVAELQEAILALIRRSPNGAQLGLAAVTRAAQSLIEGGPVTPTATTPVASARG